MLVTCAGDTYQFYTQGGESLDKTWVVPHKHLSSFTFDVSACHDASILLASILGQVNSSAYEITIGAEENTKAIIRKAINGRFEVVHEALVGGLVLHCDEYRIMWVGWLDGKFEAGVGTAGQDPFVSWTDTSEDFRPIQALSFATGMDAATWNFRQDQGQ